MIEYILLFSLGFLTAVLLVMLLAPVVRRRLVQFTETRIRATMPLSVSELRAQIDMARAEYAVENAKLVQTIRRTRERSVYNEARAEKYWSEVKQGREEIVALQASVVALKDQADELRVKLGEAEGEIVRLDRILSDREKVLAEANLKAQEAVRDAEHLGAMMDTGKIDIATRDTEIESLHSAFNLMKHERDHLRGELRQAEDRAARAEAHRKQDSERLARLQERLDEELAMNAAEEDALDRLAERDKLKENLKAVRAASLQALRAQRQTAANQQQPEEIEKQQNGVDVIDQGKLATEIKDGAASVFDILDNNARPEKDAVLREEIAAIAARMVALTAAREGEASPLPALLEGEPAVRDVERVSLAQRSQRVVSGAE